MRRGNGERREIGTLEAHTLNQIQLQTPARDRAQTVLWHLPYDKVLQFLEEYDQ